MSCWLDDKYPLTWHKQSYNHHAMHDDSHESVKNEFVRRSMKDDLQGTTC